MPKNYTLDDFDFELPPELIAQHPTAQRSASRLLDGTTVPPTHRVFRDLPGLLQAGDLLVFNDTQVIKARLYGHKATGGAVELLVERILPGTHEVWAHIRASKSPRPGSRLQLGGDAGQGACRTWAVESENRPQRGQFLQDLQTHNPAMGQKAGEQWSTAGDLPPTPPKSDSLPGFEAVVLGRCGPDNGMFHLRLPADPLSLLGQHGHVPLPPYITHSDTAEDESRYQTVFARQPGAVAAPTASLHFDEAVLQALAQRGIEKANVTLHVGAGTFQPVRTQNLAEHRMHSECYEIPPSTVQAIHDTHARGGRVIAAGTTTLRALESGAQSGQLAAGARETDIFITPGFEFRVVDTLITNFHLPKSTLMMLVSAFAGHPRIQSLYQEAIAREYRFFSYGDAMLLQRDKPRV